MLVWDEKKCAQNKAKHGLSFDAVYDFDWDTSITLDRSRPDIDGETRWAAVGWLYGKLHTIIFTYRATDLRIISLRRSNKREETDYAQRT
ncbi:MAG: BrnT family toxin [Alphaproteobacteria bacterium]|nr:BrnT family toxin [Alphaproteobacteria bacterium]